MAFVPNFQKAQIDHDTNPDPAVIEALRLGVKQVPVAKQDAALSLVLG